MPWGRGGSRLSLTPPLAAPSCPLSSQILKAVPESCLAFGRLGTGASGTQQAEYSLPYEEYAKRSVEVVPWLPRKSLLASWLWEPPLSALQPRWPQARAPIALGTGFIPALPPAPSVLGAQERSGSRSSLPVSRGKGTRSHFISSLRRIRWTHFIN